MTDQAGSAASGAGQVPEGSVWDWLTLALGIRLSRETAMGTLLAAHPGGQQS